MSRARLSIRWKILALLGAIALGPLLFIAWTDLRTIAELGSALAGQSAQSLSAQTRANLLQIADSQAQTIQRQREVVELLVRLQAREVEQVLASRPRGAAPLLWAETLDATAADASPKDTPTRYFRQLDETRQQPLRLSLSSVAVHLAPGVSRESMAADAQRLTSLTPLLRELHADHESLLYWQYVALENGVHASYPGHGGYPANFDPRTRIWYTRQRARHAMDWSPPHTDVSTRLAMVSATMPLFDRHGGFAGVTGIDVRVTQLLKSLRLPRHIGAASQVLVTALPTDPAADGELHVVARNDHLDTGADWEEPRDVEALRLDRAFDLERLVGDMRAGTNGMRTVSLRGEAHYCVYRQIGDDGLYLVFLVATRAATRPAQEAADYALTTTRRQQDALLLIACAVAILVGLLSIYASRAITGPISALERAVSAVADGDFSSRVDISSGDELETLGDSFNTMIPRLEAHTRVQESLALAREVQQQLLPRQAPSFGGLDVAGLSLYCDETGGDYFDFLDLRDAGRQTLGAVIGDVSGHGVAAALLMATARALLHGSITPDVTPASIMTHLNRHLAADVRPGHFMTLFALFIDVERQEFVCSSAGHDPALWWQDAQQAIGELSGEDIPLAIDRAWQFHDSPSAAFGVGDVVLLATDGLWETRTDGGERFGKTRLRALLREHHARPAQDIAQAVLDALAAFRGPSAQHDDVTVVVIRAVEH